jgi:hypothetical protein
MTMNFIPLSKTQMPVTSDYTCVDYRWLCIYEADESLFGVPHSEIKDRLLQQLEEEGVLVKGTRCYHSHDCCGNWYPDAVEILHIDPCYDQVIFQQIFRKNV